MAGVFSLLLAVIVFVIEHVIYGWIAGKILRYDGSILRNFVVGCIGDFVSYILVFIVGGIINFLKIDLLIDIFAIGVGILSYILPIIGSTIVMYIYKS